MNEWLADIAEHIGRNETCVLITVVTSKGSTPRDAGTKMVVGKAACYGTIGGGHLEYKAIQSARRILTSKPSVAASIERYPLGPALGQCCGGLVQVLLEQIGGDVDEWVRLLNDSLRSNTDCVVVTQLASRQFTLWQSIKHSSLQFNQAQSTTTNKLVVTAGECFGDMATDADRSFAQTHAREILSNIEQSRTLLHLPKRTDQLDSGVITTAKSNTLSDFPLLFEPVKSLDFNIYVFGAGHVGKEVISVLDGLPCRVKWIDSRVHEFPAKVPANVSIEISKQPETEVDSAPAGCFLLIMTHNHALDLEICERGLRRKDITYCGLIGSMSKRRNFTKRLQARGVSVDALNALTCPIGVQGISGKHPREIAIAVTAEILKVRELITPARNDESFDKENMPVMRQRTEIVM